MRQVCEEIQTYLEADKHPYFFTDEVLSEKNPNIILKGIKIVTKDNNDFFVLIGEDERTGEQITDEAYEEWAIGDLLWMLEQLERNLFSTSGD